MGIFESKPVETNNKRVYIKKNIDKLFNNSLNKESENNELSYTINWNNLTFTENDLSRLQNGGFSLEYQSKKRYMNYLPKNFLPKYYNILNGGYQLSNNLINNNSINNNLNIESINTDSINELNSINNRLNKYEKNIKLSNNNNLLSATSTAHINSINNLPFSATSNSHINSINNLPFSATSNGISSLKSLDVNSLTSDYVNGANISYNYSDNDVNQVNNLKDLIKKQLGGCGCSTTSSIPELKGGFNSSESERSNSDESSSESDSISESSESESDVQKMTKDGTTSSSDNSESSNNSENSSTSNSLVGGTSSSVNVKNNNELTSQATSETLSESVSSNNINIKPFYSTEDASEYFNKMKNKKINKKIK